MFTDEPSILSPIKIKKEKETVAIKQESEEFGGTKKKSSKFVKKGNYKRANVFYTNDSLS